MLEPKKRCQRCDDNFYNTNDCNSIRKTMHCVYCAKEVKFKKDLVVLKKLNNKKK